MPDKPRQIKCVECHKDADYILGGDSVCKRHYDMLLSDLKDSEKEHQKYMRNYNAKSILNSNCEFSNDKKHKWVNKGIDDLECTACKMSLKEELNKKVDAP